MNLLDTIKDTSKSCVFDFPDRPSRPIPPQDGDGNPPEDYPYEPHDDWPNIDPHPEDPGSEPDPDIAPLPDANDFGLGVYAENVYVGGPPVLVLADSEINYNGYWDNVGWKEMRFYPTTGLWYTRLGLNFAPPDPPYEFASFVDPTIISFVTVGTNDPHSSPDYTSSFDFDILYTPPGHPTPSTKIIKSQYFPGSPNGFYDRPALKFTSPVSILIHRP